MKQAIIYGFCLGLSLLISCNEDRNRLSLTGELSLSVERDNSVLTKANEKPATDEPLRVDIMNADGDTIKSYNDYLTEVKGERLVLPIGMYAVAVRSSEFGGWEAPMYEGLDSVQVLAGEITQAKVICQIANTKVSVLYTDEMKEKFIDYQTTISNESGSLVYTRDEYRAGYFTPEPLTAKLKLVNQDGNEFYLQKIIYDIEPRYHYIFKYSLGNNKPGDDSAGADFDVSVDESAEKIEYTIFIKEESLLGNGTPYADLKGFTDGGYTFRDGSEAPNANTIQLNYNVGSKRSLKSFVIKTIVPEFVDAGLGTFDMMKEEDAKRASEKGFIALPIQPIENNGSYQKYAWNLTSLLENLHSVNDRPTEYPFSVMITDDYGQEATVVSFTIRIIPNVEASVSVPLCWSTFALLKGNCVYEDSYFKLMVNGKEIDIKEVQRDKTNGDISVLLTGLDPKSTYSYTVASESKLDMQCGSETLKLELPSEVSNLSFENWTKRNGAGAIRAVDYQSPNADGVNDWDSGNRGANSGFANLNPTQSINEGYKGKAVQMTTAEVFNMLAAASIFTGTFNSAAVSGSGKLTFGIPYRGYPTKLKGYYKYSPATINQDKGGLGLTGYDYFHIYVALSTKKFNVDTSNKESLFTKDKDGVFAYGELFGNEKVEGKETNGFKSFDIPLVYYKGKETPKSDSFYIIIVASASKYGDYFTGGAGSVLYIDEFSLDYDYNPASFADTDLKGMKPISIKTEE